MLIVHFEAGVTGPSWSLNQVASAKAAGGGQGPGALPKDRPPAGLPSSGFHTAPQALPPHRDSRRKCVPRGAVLMLVFKSLSMQIKYVPGGSGLKVMLVVSETVSGN